jgi:hypothetical protein
MNIAPVSIDGQKIGEVVDDIVFFTKRVPAKHLFRGGKKTLKEAMLSGTGAWGIDGSALSYLKSAGVLVVCVDVKSKVYWTSVKKLTDHLGPAYWLNMGFGLQRFMRLAEWNTAKSVQWVVERSHEALKGAAA